MGEDAARAVPKAAPRAVVAKAQQVHQDQELPPEAKVLQDAHGLAAGEARVLAASPKLGRIFAGAIPAGTDARAAASWLVSELPAALGGQRRRERAFDGAALAELVRAARRRHDLAADRQGSARRVGDKGGSPRAIVEKRGVQQLDDAALGALID